MDKVSVLTAVIILLCVFGGNGEKSDVKLDPTVENKNGTNFIWQIPDTPKAVVFIAHGCYRKALYYWDKSPKCPDCVGYPEERRFVIDALAKKFAVLAISSAESCWQLYKGAETSTVKDIIQWWVVKQNLEKLPLVGVGTSGGGKFLPLVVADMKFSSITLMVADGLFDQIDDLKGFPPTLFVDMPKDEKSELNITRNIERLKDNGVDVAEVQCKEVQLSPEFLADRIPALDLNTSKTVFKSFQKKNFINETGYVIVDYYNIKLQIVAAFEELKSLGLLPDVSVVEPIISELKMANAGHEMTSMQNEKIFNWYESHM